MSTSSNSRTLTTSSSFAGTTGETTRWKRCLQKSGRLPRDLFQLELPVLSYALRGCEGPGSSLKSMV